MERDNSTLIGMLLESEAIRFGEFTLTSGRKSTYYCDIKKAMTQPAILREIASLLAPIVHTAAAQRIAGMELGAVPIAAAVALEMDRPFLIIRKGKRSHGTGRQIEGEFHADEKVFIVEDVATTGGSIVRTAGILRDAGLRVAGTAVVVDRQEGAAQLLEEHDMELFALVNMSKILDARKSE